MYGINSEPPKNCLDCPLCQGEYGKGNEKSYCAIKSEVKLKYNGSRPKGCPIVADPLPQWQIDFITVLIDKAIPRGEWVKKGIDYACNRCGWVTCQRYDFCVCGARMVNAKGGV